MTIQESVKQYREIGLNVIPCKPKDKRPSINWKQYQNDSYTGDISNEQNIAIICGKISNSLIVIDIDNPDETLLDKISPNILDETLVVKTGSGGHHIYLRCYETPKTSRLNNADKVHIDIQSDGTYVIAPPSIHPNGNQYEVISKTSEIKQLTREDLATILHNIKDLGFKMENQKTAHDIAVGGIEKGNRNSSAFKYACLLLGEKRLDQDTAWYEMQQWNHGNSPPLDESELKVVFNSASKTIKNNPQSVNLKNELKASWAIINSDYSHDDKENARVRVNEIQEKIGVEKTKFPAPEISKKIDKHWKILYAKKGSGVTKKEKENSKIEINKLEKMAGVHVTDFDDKDNPDEIDLNHVRDFILSRHDFMTIDDKNRELHYFKGGVFGVGGETAIDTDIEEYYQDESTSRFRHEVTEKIKIKTLTNKDDIDADDNIKNLRNGLLNLETGVLEPHRANYKSIIQWSVSYNKNAKCLKIFKFLKDVILEDKERLTVLEMMAELLWSESTLTKSYFLLGFGSNGKSALRDIVLTMLDVIHNADLSFEDLSDRYLPADLDGKLVNFPDEIDDTKIIKSASWKSTTSKKSIKAQRKFGQPFSFVNIAKHIMPCNHPPQIDDKSDGTYRRIVPIHFDQIFDVVLTDDLKKKGHRRVDEKFVKSLLEDEEISGLFNILILIVRQLKKRKSLTFSLTVDEVRTEWETITNTTKSFINDQLVRDENGMALKTDYYRAFVNYCTEKRFKIDGINTFYANFQKEGAIDKKAKLNEKSKPQHCFVGFWFKDKPKVEPKESNQSTLPQ